MSEDETEEQRATMAPTTDDPELGSDRGATRTDALAVAAHPTEDFDHRLLFSRVQLALFGEAESLRISKYRIDRHLGEGGMGQVYLCHDETLDRRVAVKRVRGLDSAVAQQRLRREAVALAQLSHDNVVQVYDSGEHEGQTYVAMEYVEGQTLREWMLARHSIREILELFVAIGHGLVAAHAVGLVHRDFKPENVLIDTAGKPKVADFGLVCSDGVPARIDVDTSEGGATRGLTAAGSVVGTRQYMPLEQILGERVGPNGDQFAFCMTLYEALWGEQPFPYASFAARTEALRADQPKTPANHRELFRVLRRGLAREPTKRWGDMSELLRSLERASTRRRRLAVGGGLGLGLALVLLPMLRSPVEQCEGIADQLDDLDHEGLERRLASLDAPHVARSRELLRDGLDRWSAAWITERAEACHALHDAGADPGQLAEAEARTACLSRQEHEIETLVTELVQGDADTLAHAVLAISTLPAPASCDDPDELDAEPLSPELGFRVDELRNELARVHQLRLLGARDRSRASSISLESRARALDYAPLLAQVLAERGKIEDEAGAPTQADALYREALVLARKLRSGALEAELLQERAELSVFELANVDVATERYGELAAHVEVNAVGPALEAGVEIGRGRLAELRGDRPQAAALYWNAIERMPEGAPELPAYYELFAGVAELTAGRDASRRAYELAEQLWGPEHPRTAEYMRDYGIFVEERLGEAEGAQLRMRAAAILGESGVARDRAIAEFELARWATGERDWDAAIEHARALARLQDAFLPPEHPDRGEPEYLLASIEFERGNTEAAREHARAALRHFDGNPALRGETRVLTLRNYLANVLIDEGDLDGAREQAKMVLQLADAGSHEAAIARLRLAELAVRRDDPSDADALLRECAGQVTELGEEQLTYELLRAIVDLRLTPPQPLDRDALDRARQHHANVDLRVPAWLAQLGVSEFERRALGY
jgi:tetratricopeptide (TPR) repeat protein